MENNDNLERLTAAGMFKKTPLPENFQRIIADLDKGAVDALISVKQSFDKAGISPEEDGEFREYIHWF
jgi:hypothetical protein